MWAALGSLALMLGLGEASKLIQNWRSLTPTKATQIANQIISAAEKKGSAMINKALSIIQNIPMLSSSPALKNHLIKARQNADKNYNDVESRVADMKLKANQTATTIQNMPERSTFTAMKDTLATGKSDEERATELGQQALNNVENFV